MKYRKNVPNLVTNLVSLHDILNYQRNWMCVIQLYLQQYYIK